MSFLKIPLRRLSQAGLLMVAVACIGALVPDLVHAQPGNGNANRNNNAQQRGNQAAEVTLDIDAAAIRQLAVDNRLTGYQGLPPGIQRNLARGKPLPPGLARKRVPASMLSALPVVAGHEWQAVGQDLLLVEAGTLLVVEILDSVFQ